MTEDHIKKTNFRSPGCNQTGSNADAASRNKYKYYGVIDKPKNYHSLFKSAEDARRILNMETALQLE